MVGVALVVGTEEGLWSSGGFSRTVSLLLAAHGVAVVVMGSEERALGEAVGELVYGGGRGRHVVGDPRVAEHLAAAIEKADSVFGPLGIVIACSFSPGEIMGALGPLIASRAIACDVLLLRPSDAAPDKLAERVAALLLAPTA